MRHTKIIFMLMLHLGCVPGGISINETIGADDEVGTTDSGSDTSSSSIACDGVFAEVECSVNDPKLCRARWPGTEAWSLVVGPDVVSSWPEVASEAAFDCGPKPSEVDGCGKVDDDGHVACWVWEGECARVSFPLCAVAGASYMTSYWPDWMQCNGGDAIGVTVLCSDEKHLCWMEEDPTSAVFPFC